MGWRALRIEAVRARVARTDPHVLLLSVLASVFVLDVLASILFPYARYVLVTEPSWEAASQSCAQDDPPCPGPIPRSMVWDGILIEYRLDLWMTFSGMYLLVMPVGWLLQGVSWWPWQPFVWLAAVGSGAAVLQIRRLSLRARLVYAFALALLVSGFAAYHWSTVGD